MRVAQRVNAQPVPAVAAPQVTRTQIIGLLKARTSGITLSRHAYAEVLRTIYPDLADVPTESTVRSRVNVWAARPLSPLVLDELGRHKRPGKNIWCFVCESDVLPERSLEACANADQVWVPTAFVLDVCVAGGMPAEKVKLVPYYLRGDLLLEHSKSRTFRVLVSWDGRSSVHRKHVVGCIDAFQEAWPRSRKVELRLKTRDLRDDHRALIKAAIRGDDRITLDERTVDTVDEIFEGAGVLLHLHRAEGYGRHIIEAMQRGVPVICTDYSGPRDWVYERNAWPIKVSRMISTQVQTEYQYPQGGRWADPAIWQAALALREVAKGGSNVVAKVARAKRDADSHASLQHSREAMVLALRELGEEVS